MSKYSALTDHLSSRREARVPMRFAELEAVLGFPLPASARTQRPWWANSDHGHVQARGWLDAGFRSEQVDLESERLVFVRLNTTEAPKSGTQTSLCEHPMFGCMAGTITLPEGLDLTEPAYSDTEMEGFLDRKAVALGAQK